MKWQAGLLAAAVAVALGIGGGYWWGTRTQSAGPVQVAADAVNPSPTNAKAERKILYYRNPMGLPDTSPVPKKDPMGMDYVAVYDGDEPDTGSNQIKISVDKVQKLGVRSEPASMRALDKVVKAVGRIEVDERRVFAIAPKFEGWWSSSSSMPPASPSARANHCSRYTARNWCRRSANMRSPPRRSRRSRMPARTRRPA